MPEVVCITVSQHAISLFYFFLFLLPLSRNFFSSASFHYLHCAAVFDYLSQMSESSPPALVHRIRCAVQLDSLFASNWFLYFHILDEFLSYISNHTHTNIHTHTRVRSPLTDSHTLIKIVSNSKSAIYNYTHSLNRQTHTYIDIRFIIISYAAPYS